MTEYSKAIAATVAAIVAILASVGVDIDPTVSTAVITLLGALAVYLIPNRPVLDDQDRERIGLD